ncbi:hybrid sensor histidine kinase/response regulator [Haliangium sp.]|uniref:hybrid sensor histidine kinase/response regulator n=1 Tax=Haliangium sp. TaxID=2663208 RepID=UPI003D140217
MADKRHRILIVDDEQLNLDILVHLLGEDYKLAVATSGERALELARKLVPDLVLLDVSMPNMDGYAVCATLKADPALRAIPVIFVTTREQPVDEQRGLEAGAIDYITKPFSPSVLCMRVRNHVALKQYQERLEALVDERTEALARRTEQLEHANAALVRAKEAAEEASRAKSAFLRNVSHELRTPLSGIVGGVSLLRAEPLSPTAAEVVSFVQLSADALEATIVDILSFTGSVDGTVVHVEEPFSVRALLAGVPRTFVHKGKRLELALSCAPLDGVPAVVSGDRPALAEVLRHLAGNAAKFSERAPTASLRADLAEREGDVLWLRFTLEDRGVGVPEHLRERVFEPFVQADDSDMRRFDGLGIGLAICKYLVGHMGGRIWVEPRDGGGSRFCFTARCRVSGEKVGPAG